MNWWYFFFNSGLRESLRSSMWKSFGARSKDDPRVECLFIKCERTCTRPSVFHRMLATKWPLQACSSTEKLDVSTYSRCCLEQIRLVTPNSDNHWNCEVRDWSIKHQASDIPLTAWEIRALWRFNRLEVLDWSGARIKLELTDTCRSRPWSVWQLLVRLPA